MAKKKIVLKVNISCQKCQQKLMHAVTGLQGIDAIEVDSAKSTLTVTGEADPVVVAKRTRKVGRYAEVVSVGPHPPPTPDPAKPTSAGPPPVNIIPIPLWCPDCRPMDPQINCSIL